jgi:hypothetical protein
MTFKHLHSNIQPWNDTLIIYAGLNFNDDIGNGDGFEAERYEITIPVGQYDINTILTALDTQLNSVLAGNYTITLNTDNKINITSDEYFAILSSDDDVKNPSNPLGKVLGWSEDDNLAALSHTASGFPQLGGIESAYLHSNISQAHTINYRGTNSDIFSVIPVSQAYGQTVIFQSDYSLENLIVFPNLLELNELHFRLADSRGNTLDIGGNDLEIVFELLY